MSLDERPAKRAKRGAAESGRSAVDKGKEEAVEAEEAEQGDWKETVFFWRGLLRIYYGGQQQKLTWDGSWVPGTSAAGLPSDAAFDASVSTFALTAVLPPQMSGIRLSAAGDMLSPSAMTARFKGSYLLDNGDGLNPYTDFAHSFQIFRASSDTVLVVAKGTTEFGPFISAGRLDHAPSDTTGNAVKLTLARRYLEERDKRVRWGVKELAESLMQAEAEVAEQPWRAKSMQLRYKKPKKKSKKKRKNEER